MRFIYSENASDAIEALLEAYEPVAKTEDGAFIEAVPTHPNHWSCDCQACRADHEAAMT